MSMHMRAVSAAVAACLCIAVVACGGDGDSSSSNASNGLTEADAKARIREFIANANASEMTPTCELLTDDFRSRLSDGTGDCAVALRTLTRFTGAGEENTLTDKVIDRSTIGGDTAVVVLVDRLVGGNELPVRLKAQGDEWLIDEIGTGATISAACIEERTAVEDAVDEYLTDRAQFPPDIKALVPGYLPQLPANHQVKPDGEVEATGACV